MVLDNRGICLEANPAAQALLGIQREELVGQRFDKFRAGGTRKTLRITSHSQLRTRRDPAHRAVQFLCNRCD
ncbi:MAG: PAS domain-containing protein [Candidatus Acidiferrales bacterium]